MKKILVLVCVALFLGTFVSADYAAAARFVNNNDGTIADTQTGLMWADKDGNHDTDWAGAKSYCETYSVSGKTGWRMPTIAEMAALHNAGAYGTVIKLSGKAMWSSETRNSEASIFYPNYGTQYWIPQTKSRAMRALPVRDPKQ